MVHFFDGLRQIQPGAVVMVGFNLLLLPGKWFLQQ
jgi:hypothetical protein